MINEVNGTTLGIVIFYDLSCEFGIKHTVAVIASR